MGTLCKTSNSLYTVLFLNESPKLWLNRHNFLIRTVFLSSKFKLEYVYSGVNFAGKMFVVIFLAGTYFCRSLEKSQKLHVPHGISCLSKLCLFCCQLVAIFAESN